MKPQLFRACTLAILVATSLTLAGQQKAEEQEKDQPAASQQAIAEAALPPGPQTPAVSRAPQPLRLGPVVVSGSLRTRLEAWDWFDGAANDSYVFPHTILRLAFGQQIGALDWQIELAAPVVLGLPSDAVAPGAQGQLGLGATYFAANGQRRNSTSIFPSKAYLRLKNLDGNEASYVRIGRFEFVEGTEATPKDPTLAALKSMRINHRLIGSFPWPANARSQDGVTVALNPGGTNLTFVASRPTRGVFQTDGLGHLDIGLLYGAFTVPVAYKQSAGELRLFGIGYDDARAVIKTDNRPQAIRASADRFENIKIGTFGLHYLHVFNAPSGKFDVLFWGVKQAGTWGVQDHRASALAAEAGWHPNWRFRPWLRAGYFRGSGDDNPADNVHGTFSSLLPTPRWYARYPFYNFQNNEDFSASVILRPASRWNVRSEFHVLRLSSRSDLWYQGGGPFQPRTFGYVGRPGNGNRGLGNLWDASADYAIDSHWSVGLYFANVWGRGVMKALYPAGQNSQFGYTELTYKF